MHAARAARLLERCVKHRHDSRKRTRKANGCFGQVLAARRAGEHSRRCAWGEGETHLMAVEERTEESAPHWLLTFATVGASGTTWSCEAW